MEPWTEAQSALAVKAFYKNSDSFVVAQRLQLKLSKVGSKMAIAASAPVLPNQKKKTVLHNRPIHCRTLYNSTFYAEKRRCSVHLCCGCVLIVSCKNTKYLKY